MVAQIPNPITPWKNLFVVPPSTPISTNLDHINPASSEKDEMALSFEDAVIEEHGRKWANCLVGYFIGKSPYFVSLRDALSRKWKLQGTLQMFTMDHGFFLFKFLCEEDCTRVLEDNGQNFGGRPLILQRWERNTTMETKKLTEILIWIKLHGRHLKFWNHHCLRRIASLIGKPLYMDTQTAESSRLNYARLCVLVSADQSLPESIKLRTSSCEIIQQIDYDWKPSSCSFCKDFSHSTKACHLYSNHVHPQPKKEWRPVSKIHSKIVSEISGSVLHQYEATN
ncbi:uncharacterized protein LOC143847192 [Tasmannia lanceolata]|uniref:uncharacterized protein LOC143847192 n=1 Tax=Tasmannia lanceolata TaxID=3420 RepID=UPI00406305AB